jgi:carbon storage regulator
MLVLSRKNGESINIGGNIEVRVLDICGGRVRLGLSAPQNVNIRRQEISPACTGPWDDRNAVDALCAQT